MSEFLGPPPAGPPPPSPPTNEAIARALEETADLLEAREGNPFRVRAFRRAARSVLESKENLADLTLTIGPAALRRLPGIGEGLAGVIDGFVRSGGKHLAYRGVGEVAPLAVLTSIPGIGEVLARRILEELQIRDLEDLEVAIYEGRLEQVPGFGRRRTAALRQMMNSLLGRRLRERSRDLGERHRVGRPPIPLLLEVDEEYRRGAREGTLRTIAPRRFNPDRRAWLPLLETRKDGWTFRALFSNTAQAHALGKTGDWVVVYFDRAGETNQCTVVTETRGPLAGRRVVRGRESELMSG